MYGVGIATARIFDHDSVDWRHAVREGANAPLPQRTPANPRRAGSRPGSAYRRVICARCGAVIGDAKTRSRRSEKTVRRTLVLPNLAPER